ncbi:MULTISPECIES: hypothetical protein [Halomonas]|uniref:Terminase n=1 Tax=Halomonas halophila TaxID=29573 RepID=A0ABQ0U3G4_9GAMM|nr:MULTISPECIES: hypothetical protein [Halomonas]MDR5890291.1 hypothetical protein [Halomonas salina]WJY05791.1 hypothetical protein QWG60_08655 [Halomonas halophila]GEK72947.1 hypothetical protein HHA04nite_14910 [Halomonas halophila]
MNIVDFIEHDALTPGSFEGDTWEPWKAILSGAFGLPMDDERLALFKELSGDREAPTERVRELFVIAGRRSAKSNTAAAVAVYLATVGAEIDGLLDKLKPGERGVVQLVAVDRDQAKVLLGYIHGMFDASPSLNAMVTKRNAESIDLDNRVSIQVATNSFKSVRGRTAIAVLMDECAFFKDEHSASPDIELYRALVPALATTGGLLIGISSPYAKKGLLHQKWRKHYGQNSDILVIQGATTQFNPTIDRRVIDDAIEEDPEGAKSEWLGQFRDDISGFIQREVVERAMRTDPLEYGHVKGVKYFGFADPAGGGKDEFTMAIGHVEDETTVIDVVRGQRGTPAQIVAEYAELFKAYGVRKIVSDRFAGTWPADEFKKHGIECEQSASPKSQLYADALSRFNSGQVELPPDDKLVTQLCNLERRTSRGGRDSIDHPAGQHDDRANAVCGLLDVARGRRYVPISEWM